jgi:hypothetical protein
MRYVLVAVSLFVAALPVASGAAPEQPSDREPEGCQAFNPGQPKCSYVVTHETDSPVTGVAGAGDWIVKVKRGKGKKKKVERISSSSSYGEPTTVEFQFREGDKVIAEALSPGSGLIVGHAD